MSNKAFNKLNPIDRDLRKALPTGMRDGVDLTIEKVCGFELFNTRPYHNYETWSDGWRISGRDITVSAEDLDDAVALWIRKYQAAREAR